MANIADIKSGDRTIEILHPNGSGEQIGIRVTVKSIDDDSLEKIKRNITDRRLYLEARGKTLKAEEIQENRTNLLFAALVAWEWYEQKEVREPPKLDDKGKEVAPGRVITEYRECPDFNGTVPELNRKNVTDVFKTLPWFADQVNEAMGDTSAFFDHSKPN